MVDLSKMAAQFQSKVLGLIVSVWLNLS